MLLKIVAIVVLFSWVGQYGFDLPKSLVSRAIAWPTAVLLGLALWRYGPAIVPRSRVHLAVLAYLGAAVLSAAFAEDRYLALYGERDRYLGLTFLADMTTLYLAVAIAFRTRDWLRLAQATAFATGAAIAYGVLQRLDLDPIRWRFAIVERPIGTIGNTDIYGHYLAAVAAACAGIALAARDRRLRRAALALAAAAALMVTLAGTRGAVVTLALTGLLVSGLAVAAHPDRRVRRGAMAIVAVGLVALFLSPSGQRFFDPTAAYGDRLLLWQGALATFLARPLVGWGPDGFVTGFLTHRPPGMEAVLHQEALHFDQAHDWVLQSLATVGLLGTLALIALIALTVAGLLRHRAGPHAVLARALALAAFAYWVNGLTSVGAISVDWIPWVLAAAAAWLDAGPRPPALPVRPLPRAAVALATAAAVLVALTGWNAWHANIAIARAASAFPADAQTTVDAAHEAIVADPGRGDHWNYRGLGFLLQARYALAADDFAEAARRSPDQSAYWLNLAQARLGQALSGDTRGGGIPAALAAAQRAVAVDPAISYPHRGYAEIALRAGEPAIALDEAATALALYQGDDAIDALLAEAALATPDRAAALRAVDAALARKPASRALLQARATLAAR